MAQGNLAGIADDQVEAEGQDDIDASQDAQMQDIGAISVPRPLKMPWGRMKKHQDEDGKGDGILEPGGDVRPPPDSPPPPGGGPPRMAPGMLPHPAQNGGAKGLETR